MGHRPWTIPLCLPCRILAIPRAIAAALEAARDGDVITLLPGTHLTGQLSLTVSKRVAIRAGSSRKGQVVLDHRWVWEALESVLLPTDGQCSLVSGCGLLWETNQCHKCGGLLHAC